MPETEQNNTAVKEVDVDGYKFAVDTDLLDDVETFELIDRIENKNQIAAIVPLLEFIIGPDAYQQMKAYFTKMDAEAHKDQKDYKPRFRLSKLQQVYLAIVEKFNPKV
jgi:hypothetical protein